MRELIEIIIKDKGAMFQQFKNERSFKKQHLYLDKNREIRRIVTLEELEKRHILDAYRAMNESVSGTARLLGVSRNTLYLKLSRYGIEH
jgi:transcriptional regulator of acetoin/glycerol metabolism